VNVDERLERASRVIAELRQKLAAGPQPSEPVAIVGMSCRFPGDARDCASFWRMVADGAHAVRAADATRGDLAVPIDASRPLALVDDIASFDAGFFDVSPREAIQMDPQQRMFLEVAWEALEDAGQTRARLAGSDTATFVGVSNHSSGYLELTHALGLASELSATGNSHDVIAGRLAYWLDLRGPTAVVNTACSSSLVAVHLACGAIIAGECRTAIAGGVNAILSRSEGLEPPGMLAPDGRCKTFDARADGYGRGEGCGVVVLKRLSHARADRDRILAVIRATVTNQDGRTNGLTAPSGTAQRALLRRALERAGVARDAVTYVETHGTGTSLGDPIEVEAIADVYGAASDGALPCALGAAKANINHLEGAAGVAGLIKAVLALRERTIPPVAGFAAPNPHLALDGSRVFVPRVATPWHANGAPRVAAVSSFSWSGTNAHAVVEEAPALGDAPVPARAVVVAVSAADPRSVADRADALAAYLETIDDGALESVAWTSTARRTSFAHRIAVSGADARAVAGALRARARSAPCESAEPPRLGIAFADDDVPARDAASLYAAEPAFRDAADACAAQLARAGIAGTPFGEGATMPRNAAAFVAAVAMHALLRSWGVAAAAVRGDGAGAVAARFIAGECAIADAAAALSTASRTNGDVVTALRGAGAAVILAFGAPADADAGVVRYEPGDDARATLMRALAALYEAGVEPDWNAVFDRRVTPASLPAYPFRRRRYWIADGAQPVRPVRAESAVAADAWFFETAWERADDTVARAVSSCAWAVVGDGSPEADAFAAAARAAGDRAHVVDSRDRASLDGALDACGGARAAIVDLRPLRASDADADAAVRARALTEALASLERRAVTSGARLFVATRGAQCVLAQDVAVDAGAAALWGYARCAMLARPERWGGILDLDPSAAFDAQAAFVHLRGAAAPLELAPLELALRERRAYAPLLRTATPPPRDALQLDPSATYVVTGAFGAIGPPLATWLATRGAKHLVLVARRSASSAAADALREALHARGVDVRVESCDVGDAAAVAAMWSRVRDALPPVRGIFHAAGRVDDPADDASAGIASTFRAKVDGTAALVHASGGDPLDLFVCFSSAAASIGDRNRAAYGAANAFVDALMASRRARGLHGVAVDWGLWSGHDDAREDVAYLERSGMRAMPAPAALDALGRIARCADARAHVQPLVADLDVPVLATALAARGRGAFVRALLAPERIDESAAEAAVADVVHELRRSTARERQSRVTALVVDEVRRVLELADDDRLDTDRGFFDLGMDSHMTVQLRERLQRVFGMPFPSTLALEYPTVAALVDFIDRTVLARAAEPHAQAPRTTANGAAEAPDERAAVAAIDALDDDAVADALAAELRDLAGELQR